MEEKTEVIKEIEGAMGLKFPIEQIDIITHKGKPSNVISCAGSGKTTLMIASICYMQMKYKIDPAKIIVISFNKSAVDEIKTRYGEISRKLSLSDSVTFRTFHALYYMILKYYENKINREELNVMGEPESAGLFSKAFYSNSKNKTEEAKESMLSLRGYAVNNLITSAQDLINTSKFITSELDPKDYFSVIKEYRDLKQLSGKLDFEDLQIKMLELLKSTPEAQERVNNAWDYWFIDEYQDISKVQMEILKLSIKDINNLVTIGDEDQAIYEFRGSKVDYIVDFPIYFNGAKRYIMDINYRCPSVILKRAEQMINNNVKRVQKNMKAFNEGGEIAFSGFNTVSESSIKVAELINEDFFGTKGKTSINLSEIAVLYRNTRQQIFIVDQLIQRGVPVKVMRKSNLLHTHSFIRDFRNIVEFALNDEDPYLLTQVFTRITKYVRKTLVTEVSNKMISHGGSWREYMMSYENESINQASIHLNVVKELVERKSCVSEIVDEVMKMYSNFLEFTLTNMTATKDEITDVINYTKYVGSDKTFKQFVYYIERSKSLIEMYAKDKDAVTITTMHTVKGLEYKHVYILDASDEVVPNYKREESIRDQFGEEESDDYIEQERRLFYVACTRAKEKLYITYPLFAPSRYLKEQLEDTGHELPRILGEELVIKEE